jgi:hypothetical protein
VSYSEIGLRKVQKALKRDEDASETSNDRTLRTSRTFRSLRIVQRDNCSERERRR